MQDAITKQITIFNIQINNRLVIMNGVNNEVFLSVGKNGSY